ncbi:hypothetical protein DL762_001368 [Monosporascus cannonballus]|uniref:Uncharacterized protein n=1 Tax=Monosporascus cannonballus TaxID=155416 RepID=A0ABY0HGD5_9PEZI|nr:hypothetical protein DL762_001368 [Monosporascus cannonballus]RYP01019.1 hypothetical protein DL763_000440 [Monosporascus cannonballus]
MGFLSFLLRKSRSTNDARGLGALKSQAYEATVPANPPILGTYPMAGNGVNATREFQSSHSNINQTLPKPSAPRLVDPEVRSRERPRTAPSEQPSGGPSLPGADSQARAGLRKLPAKRQGPPSELPPEVRATLATDHHRTLSPPPLAFARDRTPSLFSSGSANSKGFVDLLDAQSAIRPSDFYGRVKAAGAKDYGEDVASRNIGENGLDIDSPEAHYLRVPRQPTPDDHFPKISVTSTANRRKSLHSYITASSSTPRSDNPPRGRKSQEPDTRISHNPLQQRSKDILETDSDFVIQPSVSKKANRITEKDREPVTPWDALDLEPIQPHDRRDSDLSMTSWEEHQVPVKPASRRRTVHYAPSPTLAKPASKRYTLQSLQNIQTHNQEFFRRGSDSSRQTELTTPKSSELVRPRRDLGTHTSPRVSPSPQKPPPAAEFNSPPKYLGGLSESVRSARARSIASTSNKSVKQPHIEVPVPEQSSSLRNYSLSSETTTYSSLSSNPCRPQSRHTPSTSIDLTPTVPSFNFANFSQATLPPTMNAATQKGQAMEAMQGSSPAKSVSKSQRRQPPPPSGIDDYASSDDSPENPHKPTAESEKDLLFAENGYGSHGSQLPGLPGLFDAAVPRPTTSQSSQTRSARALHVTSSSLDSEDSFLGFTSAYSQEPVESGYLGMSSGLRVPQPSHTIAAGVDGSVPDDSSDEELNFDIPRNRTASVRQSPARSRRRRGTANETIEEEEREPAVADLATITRLRRQIRSMRGISIVVPAGDQSGRPSDVER